MASPPETPKLPDFPKDNDAAAARFELHRHKDPFPEIPSALLNSADLLDYVAAAGMLSPYAITPERRDEWLKPASCAVACTGDVLCFGLDKDKQRLTKTAEYKLEDGKRLELPANSITFLHLGTIFRIPDYIAARFNLAIREIHRGLLVGTGPLVDPGFVGRLFVPLHNLTSNNYSIKFDEPFVWVEFTKLSPNQAWCGTDSQPRCSDYVPFPERKLKRTTPAQYLDHAHEGKPIASSIPEEVERAIVVARDARSDVRRLRTTLRNIGVGAAILTGILVLLPMVSLVSDTNARIDSLTSEREKTRTQISDLRARDTRRRKQIADLLAGVDAQAAHIKQLQARAASSRR